MFAAYPPTQAFVAAPAGMALVLIASAAIGPVVVQFRSDLPATLTALLITLALAGATYTGWTVLALRLGHQQQWLSLVSLPVVQRLVLLTMIGAATGIISLAISSAVWPRARWSPEQYPVRGELATRPGEPAHQSPAHTEAERCRGKDQVMP